MKKKHYTKVKEEVSNKKVFEKFKPLVRVIEKRKTGKEWDVVVIKSGKSKNGIIYPAELLKNSTEAFEGVKVFAHGFGTNLDGETHYGHRPDGMPVSPEMLTENYVGKLRNCKYKTMEDNTGAIVAVFECYSDGLKKKLLNMQEANSLEEIGLSIDAMTIQEQTYGGRVVKEFIQNADSVDVVTNPAAGGMFLRAAASVNTNNNWSKNMNWKQFLESLVTKVKAGVINLASETKDKSDDEIKVAVQESFGITNDMIESDSVQLKSEQVDDILKKSDIDEIKKSIEEVKKSFEGMINKPYEKMTDEEKAEYEKKKKAKKEKEEAANSPKDDPKKEAVPTKEEFNELRKKMEDLSKENSKRVIESVLSKDTFLPEESKDRIRNLFKNRVVESEKEVSDAMTEEKKYLDKLLGDNAFNAPGGRIRVTENAHDKTKKAMDLMVDPSLASDPEYKGVDGFISLGQSFRVITGTDPRDILTGHARVTEATTADYTTLLGDSMNKRLRKDFKAEKERLKWDKLVTEESITNINTQNTTGFGSFQNLDEVSEGGEFTDMDTPGKENITYTPVKYGNTFVLTREMFINDNLRALQQFPRMAGQAGARTLATKIYDLIFGYSGSGSMNSATIYDGTVLYSVAHGNYDATNPELSKANFSAAKTLMRQQTDKDGNPIMIEPSYLIVPPDLEDTAKEEIIKNDISLFEGIETIVVHPYFIGRQSSDVKTWAVMASPRQGGTIIVGYYNNKKEPEMFVQNQETVGDVFSNEKITYKVRRDYVGCAIEDYRGFYASFPS